MEDHSPAVAFEPQDALRWCFSRSRTADDGHRLGSADVRSTPSDGHHRADLPAQHPTPGIGKCFFRRDSKQRCRVHALDLTAPPSTPECCPGRGGAHRVIDARRLFRAEPSCRTGRHEIRAARVERAARSREYGSGTEPLITSSGTLRSEPIRGSTSAATGVGMFRVVEDLIDARAFDHPAEIHTTIVTSCRPPPCCA